MRRNARKRYRIKSRTSLYAPVIYYLVPRVHPRFITHATARRRRAAKVGVMATGGPGDGRRAASRHHRESRANVSLFLRR